MEIDLMAPRFKVIGPYPNSPYEVGGLVEITPSGTSYLESVTQEMSQWTNEIQGVEHYSHLDNIKAFPNLFEPLPWWSDRAIEDMPQYLKWVYDPKLDSDWGKNFFDKVKKYNQKGFSVVMEKSNETLTNYWLPATEQEYNNYISSLTPSPSKTAGEDK